MSTKKRSTTKADIVKGLHLRTKPTVTPTLKLSTEALTTPLPDGWLSLLRDFLTRTGEFVDHPIASMEHFIVTPAPGVLFDEDIPRVVGPGEPLVISLGFGNLHFMPDGLVKCPTNACDVQTAPFPFACDINACTQFHSLEPALECDKCSKQFNFHEKLISHEEYFNALALEVEANLEHPFVVGLAQYFDAQALTSRFSKDVFQRLGSGVWRYVTHNLYDQSVLQEQLN